MLCISSHCICFTFYRSNQTGGFSEEGITSRINRLSREIECVSNHLTSFAVLVSTKNGEYPTIKHVTKPFDNRGIK